MAEFTRLPMFMFCPDLLVCLHTVGHTTASYTTARRNKDTTKDTPTDISTFRHLNLHKTNIVSFDIFQSQGIGKDRQIKKVCLNTIDSKTPFGAIKQRLFPPSAGHTCKENKQASFGSSEQLTTAVLVALILLWHVRPPHCRKQKT